MSRQIRVSITDEAYEALAAESKSREVTLGEIVNAALLHWAHPQDEAEAETKQDVILLQLQRMQLMLEAVLEEQARQREAQQPQEPEPALPLPIASYDAMYGPIVPQAPSVEEQIPEAFRPPPKRGLLNRLLYKEES